jgi:hypothetical protein
MTGLKERGLIYPAGMVNFGLGIKPQGERVNFQGLSGMTLPRGFYFPSGVGLWRPKMAVFQ